MPMLKPVLAGQLSFKDRHSFTSPTQLKHPNQQNKSLAPKTYTPYTPYHHKYTYGIGLSLKPSQNRQHPKTVSTPNTSQQYFDGYLQKVIKSNFDKMTQLRTEHEKQRENLIRQIMTLKTENTLLKTKVQDQLHEFNRSQGQKFKQLSHSQEKRLLNKFASEKIISPNPEKHEQNESLIRNMKEKMEIFQKDTEECKKRNSILSLQKKNLNFTIEKLQRQHQEKVIQLQRLNKIQERLTNEVNQAKYLFQNTKIQYEAEKNQLLKQIQKLRQVKKEKERQKESKNSQYMIVAQENIIKNNNEQKNPGVMDKRVIKHFESQIKDREAQICQRNALIDELNEKIMSSALIGLNTKYKYLSKA